MPPALATSTSLRAARALPRSFLLLKKRNRYRPVAPYLTGTSFSKRTVRQIPREIASRPNRTDPNERTYERVSLPRPHDRPPPFQCTVSPVLPVTARCRFTLLLASNAHGQGQPTRRGDDNCSSLLDAWVWPGLSSRDRGNSPFSLFLCVYAGGWVVFTRYVYYW